MKKIFAFALAILMLVSMVACASNNEVVQKYIDEHGDEFVTSMEQAFATSSGMTCTSSIKAEGDGFVVHININELDDLSSEQRDLLQSTYNALGSNFETALSELQKEVPEIKYFDIVVCEVDGDEIATIHAGE